MSSRLQVQSKLKDLFDSLTNKFTSSVAEVIHKAIKVYFTSQLYDDVKKLLGTCLHPTLHCFRSRKRLVKKSQSAAYYKCCQRI